VADVADDGASAEHSSAMATSASRNACVMAQLLGSGTQRIAHDAADELQPVAARHLDRRGGHPQANERRRARGPEPHRLELERRARAVTLGAR
jgi:hypothetical protein